MIKIGGSVYNPTYFSDGTLDMRFLSVDITAPDRTVFLVWRFESIAEQIIIYNLTKYFQDIRAAKVVLVLPYIPYSKDDKLSNPQTDINTLKYFCRFINDLNFTRVYVSDPHSSIPSMLIDRVIEDSVKYELNEVIATKQVATLFYPDAATQEHYSYIKSRPSFYGEEEKDHRTGEAAQYSIIQPFKPLSYKSILMITDLIKSYENLKYAAHLLKADGFDNIYLFVTHLENSILDNPLLSDPNISHVFTTSSIYSSTHEKITVV